MSRDLLDRLLTGTLKDPDSGDLLASPDCSIVIERDLGRRASQLVEPLALGHRLALVMDEATQDVLGDRVCDSLATAFDVDQIVLGDHPHPDMQNVTLVIEAASDADALIAVGSGSINDITKYAAHLTRRPFAVFGTAPSMNGYTSVSAAITDRGLKQSLPATLAKGVFLDLEVMAAAPKRLIAAGFGDSMARSTAQTDWLLSHLILGTPYREAPFTLLRDDEQALIEHAESLIHGDITSIELLIRTLVLSGLGMTLCGGSYPASQGEHLIAHYLDMRGDDLPPAHHGEHIAITTLTMARLQADLLRRPSLQLATIADSENDFITAFGPALGASCWRASAAKRFDPARIDSINQTLERDWQDIRHRVLAVSRSEAELERALRAAGAPVTHGDAGIPEALYQDALHNARRIRDRFTSLDLIAMAVPS